ncbi:MAG TPA: hypothetical protein VE621_00725 [Bryobacteraceae bacterium]|nr:hypothetical protein [Bryobacteraceae bacterium]
MPAAFGQERGNSCEATPEVRDAIVRVREMRFTVPSDLSPEAARKLMAEMVRKHPDDVFAHLHYLRLHREKGHGDVIATYRSAWTQSQATLGTGFITRPASLGPTLRRRCDA